MYLNINKKSKFIKLRFVLIKNWLNISEYIYYYIRVVLNISLFSLDTILVTGGCGFIGSHICVSLINENFNILIIDSLVNSFAVNFQNIKKIFDEKGLNISERIQFIKGDLRNKIWVDKIFIEYSKSKKPIKYVLHFAGLKSISNSIKSPLEYWDMNLSSTLSLLSVMKKNKCFNLIFSSSATVYEPISSRLLRENDELNPTTPYGKSKLCIEEILKDLYESDKNWRIANLRYFNPVGSHSSNLLLENSKGKSSNLFPSILKTLRGEQKKLLIFGNNWPTYDGTCVRDFIHVMDLASAHIATLKYLEKNNPQIISINIGTGKGTSVLDIVKTFHSISGIYFDYDFVERRIGDQPYIVADNKLALELLEWKPKKSILDMCNDSLIKNTIKS